jgi:hypothetical protein
MNPEHLGLFCVAVGCGVMCMRLEQRLNQLSATGADTAAYSLDLNGRIDQELYSGARMGKQTLAIAQHALDTSNETHDALRALESKLDFLRTKLNVPYSN